VCHNYLSMGFWHGTLWRRHDETACSERKNRACNANRQALEERASGNPGGRPKKFSTLIGDAFCQQLAEIDSATGKTYASVISAE